MSERDKNALQMLTACRSMILRPESWRGDLTDDEGTRTNAWDASGRAISSRHPDAVAWNLPLGVGFDDRKDYQTEWYWPAVHALESLIGKPFLHNGAPNLGLWIYAEGRTHSDVIDLLDLAIARVSKRVDSSRTVGDV